MEDWVWKNAIKVTGKIYHASCYSETSGQAGVGSNSASRSGTPQASELFGKRKRMNSTFEVSKVPRLTLGQR